MKKIIIELLLIFTLIFLLAGCTGNSDILQTEKTEALEEASAQKTQEASPKRREIPIDFPFYGEGKEDKLVLAASEEGQNAYELIYYDKDGKALQQIFCGKLAEPVTFSFDGQAYGSWIDLEIFSADSDTGLLYIWKDGRFSETPIGIPKYEECRSTAMLTVAEDDKFCEKEICLLNQDKNRTDKARTFRLQRKTEETAMLFICDELYHKTLFEGIVRLDENGEQLCGISYINKINSDLEKAITMKGFTLCSPREVKWNGVDPYTFRSEYGTTGAEKENVEDYEENIEYTEFGKPDCFVSRGRVEGWSAEDQMQDILRINFIYREDGTLFYRDYYHSHQAFGTTLQGLHSFYDEQEQVILERGYITHGQLEYCYIYEDTDGETADKPTYILYLDYNMGYVNPDMIKCL